jgi:diadenylate cyclase
MNVFLEWLQALDIGRFVGPMIEVLFIAVIIYVLLKFMQGTRGAGILRGVIIFFSAAFGFAFVGSRFFQLERIGWVLENVATLLVIGVIIIFQPEIRRGLIRLGHNPLVSAFLRARTPVVVEEVVEACATMARRQIGALIAIQRQVGLRHFVEGGTRLDAEVTGTLLRTIFEKHTPLHDGAVVIQGSRVAAAGCLFPLSESPELAKELGTRHRAGVGITEESDAVAVIVSEETGRISVAVEGQLTGGISPEDLSDILTDLCVEHVE